VAFLVNQAIMMVVFSFFFMLAIFNGIFYDNLFDLYAAMFQACFLTGWAIFRFLQPYKNQVVDYVFIIVTCACQLIYFAVAYSLRTEYVWRLYRKAGADKKFRNMYKTYLKWLTFFKLDIAFSVPNVMLAVRGVLSLSWRAGLNWTMLICIIVFLVIGYIAVKREIKRLVVAWFCLYPINILYIIGMMYYTHLFNQSNEADYTTKTVALMFYITGSVTLVNRVFLGVFSYVVYKNFKQGLRKMEFVKGPPEPEDDNLEKPGPGPGGDYGYVAYGDESDGDDGDLSVNEVIKATYANLTKEKI